MGNKENVHQIGQKLSTSSMSTDISKKEIREMIVEAYFEIEKKKEELEKSDMQERSKEKAYYEDKYKIKIIRFFMLLKFYLSKNDSDSRFTLSWMAMLLSMFFLLISFICGLFVIILIGIAVYNIVIIIQTRTDIIKNILQIISYITVAVLLTVFGIFSYCTSKEVEKEKDKNYLSSVFSGITGFVALIIAFIALIK